MDKNYFILSEFFYSIQGEGVSTGVPAFFIRIASCNLQCGISHPTLQKIRNFVKEGKGSYSDEIIELMNPENDASWVCDTIPVWVKGEKVMFNEIVSDWIKNDIKDDIDKGIIHLIWTGGEPLLKVNQERVISFLYWYAIQHDVYPFSEIETNGTQYIEEDLFNFIGQINCSVKLSNSGHSKEERVVPKALERIMEHPNYWFKFVVSDEKDVYEIINDFVIPFNIPKDRVLLMPALTKQEDFHKMTLFVMEIAKKYRFRATSRMHIGAYNQLCGV